MPLSALHPAVRSWFTQALGEPTPAQRQGWPAIQAGAHTLIAAPTGTGKTLAAFLIAIDALVKQGPYLADGTQVLYISPLKALGNDIEKNLRVPLSGILEQDPFVPRIRVQVRSGDTPASERARMVRKPPHILVTTPESLYILLTSASGRAMLTTVRTVIVDEIHALAGSKRGSHLALSLERLEALVGAYGHIQRIALSATQKPLRAIADFLVGTGRPCTIIDAGHLRHLDLGVEIPSSPLAAVCSNQIWAETYQRMAELVSAHRTTLIFVSTRKLSERVAARLSEQLSAQKVACHHGSMSRERRLDAEQRLKAGTLSVLVATASLELGIDIGDVDLVIQLGSPRAISTFLQRVGRAGHGIERIPKGRLFPLTIDELAEAAGLLMAVRAGELDRIIQPQAPLDILAQQVVAACVPEIWDETALYDCLRRAWPYRALTRDTFNAVVALHTPGHGLLHRDGVNSRLRASRRARLVAMACGGAIAETALFQVREDPSDHLIGTLDEDFSLESHPGDIIQLGNASWRVLRVESRTGVMRVADAHGAPPTIPFWLGEAAARTRELSASLAHVRSSASDAQWLQVHTGLDLPAALELWGYLADARIALGALPTQQLVIAERFFDETGGMQLIIHAPFGARINRAWGLALRKRFCGGFGFELEAAANEDALLLSLGPATSFALEDVFTYLAPATVRDLLVQACITGGQFETRWRWNASRALVVERFASGAKTPAYLTRLRANDALAAAFPAALACPETLPAGPLQLPEGHPLVDQTVHDCLNELMDIDGLIEVLTGIRNGSIMTRAVDVVQPSPLALGILAAQPYAFLDDVPLEERRVRAVGPVGTGKPIRGYIADLDPALVDQLKLDIWPQPRDAEEVHEALLWMGYVTDAEAVPWQHWLSDLARARRVDHELGRWHAVEASRDPVRMQLGRLEALGPIQADSNDANLLELERTGIAMRTRYLGGEAWCHRRLLARLNRGMLESRRAQVQPASATTFLHFLARWQSVAPGQQREGPGGLSSVLDQLAGFPLPAPAWNAHVLKARVSGYRAEWLDQLCQSGVFAWARLWLAPCGDATPGRRGPSLANAPICVVRRERLGDWLALTGPVDESHLSGNALRVLGVVRTRGALFQHELAHASGLLGGYVEMAQSELVAHGLISCDAFAALRWLLLSSQKRQRALPPGGRWSVLVRPATPVGDVLANEQTALMVARQLLQRTGVVFRQTIERERQPLPWRVLLAALRTLELRGEVHGGRFITGFSGEQYALPTAALMLKSMIQAAPVAGSAVEVSAADPLNYRGILTPDERVRPTLAARVRVG